MLNNITNPASIDFSERQILGCSGTGSTNGGSALATINWLKNKHVGLADDIYAPDVPVPHINKQDHCRS